MHRAVWRMVDANANRAAEGLRAAEDILRFLRDDARGSAEARRLRHALRRAAAALAPAKRLLAARDARRDVGAGRWRAGQSRRTWRAVLAANLRRAQEATRVLEEAARMAGRPGPARRLQSIRYALYGLESAALGPARRG
ncbi:MAG: thiamine-phosphate pyrophosphorylase [bacterium]